MEKFKEIENYIKTELRERVQVDGGDMSLISIEDGYITVKVYADCSTCPHVNCSLSWWIAKQVERKFSEKFKIIIRKEVPYYYKIGTLG
jgi:Fe-S cluster biogenesis protein NfuA